MIQYRKEKATVNRTAELIAKYKDTGELSEELGNYLICIAVAAAVQIKLKLQDADYEDCIIDAVMNIMKYGLKNIHKVENKKTYYYLLMSARSGIYRWLEKHGKLNKRIVLVEQVDDSIYGIDFTEE